MGFSVLHPPNALAISSGMLWIVEFEIEYEKAHSTMTLDGISEVSMWHVSTKRTLQWLKKHCYTPVSG